MVGSSTITSLISGIVRSNSNGGLYNGAVVLSGSDVSGILPIINGGTGSSTLGSTLVGFVSNDTNITGSIANNTLTLGWTGTLASGRLNSNVVQAITNDTNITGSITAQNLTLGWTGTLADSRITSATNWNAVYNNVLSRLAVATGTAGTIFNISTTTNSLIINLPIASSANTGQLSSTDWSTFNAKQTAGNYITALTGDVTATGPGSVAATLATVNSNVGGLWCR